MILVDSSVWIDHFRKGDAALSRALGEMMVAQHPFVTAELALGSLAQRGGTLAALNDLPQLLILAQADVLAFVEQHTLYATGIGLIDAHLLVSVATTDCLHLWTRDKRLLVQAERLGLRLYAA